jgi:sortase A
MRRSIALTVGLAVFVLGLWQLGHGAWIDLKAKVAQVLLHRAWTRTLAGEPNAKPWPWADTWPVARLRAPQHQIDLFVLAIANPRTLAFGPALVSEPLEIAAGLIVIAGHRDTHFRFLKDLRPGDEIALEVAGRPTRRYRVTDSEVINARDVKLVESDDSGLVLATCYPFEALLPGGPQRYLVFSERVR